MSKLRSNKRWDMDRFLDDAGVEWKVHKKDKCEGSSCAIHNPSDHPLKDAPMKLRGGNPLDVFGLKPYGFLERSCTHGIWHSDPDSVAFYASIGSHGLGIHGCDGCCNNTQEITGEN